ncbi:AraC family transcriptional regulator ligand-binding domain-containing protein [Pseudoalteromonas distincta]|uniref:AraC family transcriptional regulator n=1 Tax=Pseudoalteromonas distincta TaxID=77608 RepID=UPI0039E92D96
MHTLADHYFSSILDYLQAQGISAETALHAINFDEFSNQHIHQLAPRISLNSYNALLIYGEQSLNDSLFGFTLGQQIRTADYGVLGYLIESSDNLSSAIKALLSYDSLVADIGKAQFELNNDTAIVRWVAHKSCNEHVVLRNMTAWVSVIRQLINLTLSPSSISFTYNWLPSQRRVLESWFKCPVKSSAEYNQISFPSYYLTLPFKTDNAIINSTFKQLSEQQLSNFKSQQCISDKVNQLLTAKTTLQNCNLIAIANALNLTPRTLQRRLKQQDLTFAQLLEKERKKRTNTLIGNTPLIELTNILGFKDQSSFNRAFYRWYGHSPSKYLGKKA